MLLLDKAIKGEPLEPEQVTPFDIAAEEEADRKSEKMAEAREKMGKLLEGAETQIELLPDSKGGTGYDKIAIPLGISATDFIGWCKGANIPQSVGATAVAGALVSSFSRKDNLTFATIYHGRRNPRYLKTMTMMVKTLPVKVSLSRDTTVSQLLKQTADNLLTARENDLYSFAEAARDYGVNSQFLFAYQGSFLTLPDVGGKPVESIALENRLPAATFPPNSGLRRKSCSWR